MEDTYPLYRLEARQMGSTAGARYPEASMAAVDR